MRYKNLVCIAVFMNMLSCLRKIQKVLLLALITVLFSSITFAQDIFAPPVHYSTSFGYSVAAGDFNGDSKLDIIMPGLDWRFYVLTGNGDGTFVTSVEPFDITAGGSPISIISGDFNGDGKIDVATANWEFFSTISIFIGNGDGTFKQTANYASGSYSSSIIAGDFNGDGRLDIAASNNNWPNYPGSVSIFIGNGDGTFQQKVEYPAGWYQLSQPHALSTGDFNGDGKIDIVTVNWGNPSTVSVLIGNGDGTFQPKRDYTTGPYPYAVTASDLNGDGKIDIITVNWGNPSTVSVLIGNGDGAFQPDREYNTTFGGGYALFSTDVAVGDFNSDGKSDLAVSNYPGSVAVLIGNGDGTFQPDKEYDLGGEAVPYAIIAGDFDGDGKIDVATANYWSGSVAILLNIYEMDNKPPIANAGPDQAIECAGYSGNRVTLDGSGSIDSDGALTYVWKGPFPEGGGTVTGIRPTITLPNGTWNITLTVNDGKADSVPDTVTITIKDTTAPTISLLVNPTTLWPPNHEYVEIVPTITASDSCDANPQIGLVSVTSNESDDADGTGDGETVNDILIKDGRIYLRAERNETGAGRIYTLHYRATDASGNSSSANAIITVPHN